MPPKPRMLMNISNGNGISQGILRMQQQQPAPVTQNTASPLTTPMIGRISSTKPGCGSCGRH